ncbi:hypothetical protein SAMN05216330_11397 [Bradyrhizobium sp. Ghvi]|nr:hypothetical protein SAMN05216330_11397 [Bradyrhizobium sp. Ghvi]
MTRFPISRYCLALACSWALLHSEAKAEERYRLIGASSAEYLPPGPPLPPDPAHYDRVRYFLDGRALVADIQTGFVWECFLRITILDSGSDLGNGSRCYKTEFADNAPVAGGFVQYAGWPRPWDKPHPQPETANFIRLDAETGTITFCVTEALPSDTDGYFNERWRCGSARPGESQGLAKDKALTVDAFSKSIGSERR